MKRFCAFFLCFVLMLNFGITAHADGSVTYDGEANEFIFAPGRDYSPTSLFSEFENVMPGDTLTDRIVIKNHISKRTKL